MTYKNYIYFILSITIISGTLAKSQKFYRKQHRPYVKWDLSHHKKPITVFIHGALSAYRDLLVRWFDVPIGLYPATVLGNRSFHAKIPYILYNADPSMFPLESFYLFGWQGALSIKAREDAAEELYQALKDSPVPVRIIGHSHGANVALNLAKIAKKYNDTHFKIERIILLAIPVQKITEDYVTDPIFENAYSFYSLADNTQTLDPQGMYEEAQRRKRNGEEVPFFSRRYFKTSNNLCQIKTHIYKRSIGHLKFIGTKFLNCLPAAIKLADTTHQDFMSINMPAKSCSVFLWDKVMCQG
jgi:pimeloyl-ACP methyl ester carboxylesterase